MRETQENAHAEELQICGIQMNILFVCRGNLQRSPTAEDMLRNRTDVDIKVKSAGVNRGARTRISADLIEWADRIYVMMEGIQREL